MNVSGKRVLVTGSAVRVGAVIARTFARNGASLIIHYHTHEDEARKLLEELGGTAAGHTIIQADLTAPDAAETIFRTVGPVDILINSAAVFGRRPFGEEDSGSIQAQFDVNFFAPFALMKAFAARRSVNEPGVIVNVLDQAITGNGPDSFGYLESKKLLTDATCAAALAFAPSVRVNAVAPGPVIAPPGLEHLAMQKTLKRVPLGRSVPPEDVASSILFLVNNESVTGSVLFVDGGQHLFENSNRLSR